jgi:hypothetical protein
VKTASVARPESRRRLASGFVIATIVVAGIAALLALPLGSPVQTTNASDSLPKVDSTQIGAIGNNDSLEVQGPPVPPTGSLSPRSAGPGKGTPAASTGARSQVGSISVNVPPDVEVTIGDVYMGIGNSRRDSMPPGRYAVRAVFPTNLEGCSAASQTAFVTVRAGAISPISMSPQPCGLLELVVRGRSDGARTVWFALQPEGKPRPADTPLTPGAKVFPVGRYKLWVGMPTCQDYSEDIEILAGQTTKPNTIVLFCPANR